MKFGHLIEYNMRNVVEKSRTKCAGETIPRPLSKKSRLSISLNQKWKVFNSFFHCMLIRGLSKYGEIKLQTTCFYLIEGFLKKQKVIWNWFPCPIFCIIFKEKYFSWDALLTDQISLPGCI